jgi:hypothetical protein
MSQILFHSPFFHFADSKPTSLKQDLSCLTYLNWLPRPNPKSFPSGRLLDRLEGIYFLVLMICECNGLKVIFAFVLVGGTLVGLVCNQDVVDKLPLWVPSALCSVEHRGLDVLFSISFSFSHSHSG